VSQSIKISFKLKESELGPYPIYLENLWCECVEGYYKIKNIPMFILNLAYGDIVDIKDVGDNQYQISKIIKPSGNSTIWMQVNIDRNEVIDKLKAFKCQVESGAFQELLAINIAKNIEWKPIGKYLDYLDKRNDIVALYASFNHED